MATEVAQLEEVTLHLAAIVANSDDAIISKDLNGVITSWNRGAERLFGYTAKEVIGQPVSILAVPERRDEMPAILDRLRRGERVDHYETVGRRKDGTAIDVSLTVSPVRSPSGEIIGASKIARYITGRKRADAALALANREIRQREELIRTMANGALLRKNLGRIRTWKGMHVPLHSAIHKGSGQLNESFAKTTRRTFCSGQTGDRNPQCPGASSYRLQQ